MFFGFLLVLFAVSDVSNVFGQECGFDDRQLMNNSTNRNGYDTTWPKFPKRRGATIVPYYFKATTRQMRREMKRVLKRVEKGLGSSCPIRFRRRRSNWNRKYPRLEITQKSRSCSGFGASGSVWRGYKNRVILRMNQNPCEDNMKAWKKVALHEMFHVFGIAHTQKRKDRNNYIRVIEENIKPDERSQYEVCQNCDYYGIPYECNSIMHYQDSTFAKYRGLPTMESKNDKLCPPQYLKGFSSQPTHNDWRSLKKALGCRY